LYLGLADCENNFTIGLRYNVIKNNIPCDPNYRQHENYYEDLPNGKGFQRIRDCAKRKPWNPYCMNEKGHLSKYAPFFHTMQNFGDDLNTFWVPSEYR
jgi:hypothetical protein